MVNPWIEHVKKYAKSHNIAYGCAISMPECKHTYKKPTTEKDLKLKAKKQVTHNNLENLYSVDWNNLNKLKSKSTK